MDSPLARLGGHLRKAEVSKDARQMFLKGGREADTFYRQRFSHDKVVRSTHGVNCTGSCSWRVFVKDGLITWEAQAVDYPTTGPDMPEYEPRGCPRGAAFSWYEYSPTRIRYPYIRSQLLKAYRKAKSLHPDPVEAFRAVVKDPQASRSYKKARGKGGFVRVSWEEAMEIVAAANVSTIADYGPDRVFGFSVLPAMSMVSFGAGARYLQLIGGVNLSFYDWYADLPVASPQVFGDQTDVPEAGDWFNSQYLIMWGSNIPLTRTPDAHFMTEARYHGTKVVAVSPDYSDNTKFADEWLRVNPGTDAALAQAMGHVILKEFHVGKQTPQFLNYMKHYTDSPFLVRLEETPDGLVPGKFLTVADLVEAGSAEELGLDTDTLNRPHPEFRMLVMDENTQLKDPRGTLADRYAPETSGQWNLRMDGISALLSLYEHREDAALVSLPRFDLVAGTDPQSKFSSKDNPAQSLGGGVLYRGVPVRKLGNYLVTTVYDLLLAQYGVERPGLPGDWPKDYTDASSPATPAWQEELTGVPAAAAERIGREWAQNALESGGRSQVILGAGVNHYYHSDLIYRAILALTSMCGTQGINGGGWAHYVGQEKVRPITGWAQYSFALDWIRPPRQMISTGFWYLTTDQWRYDQLRAARVASPLSANRFGNLSVADTLVEASERGWMPSYPSFDRSTLELAKDAKAAGKDPANYVASELAAGRLNFACKDPDNPRNFPRILFNWRTNLLGSSAKGTEYFLRHLLGTDNDVNTPEIAESDRPQQILWRKEAAQGKLDLLVSADFRNTSTTLYSDIVLPAATWYEKDDLSSTDMHPYVHAFTPAIQPPWEARTDFELFQDLANRVSQLAKGHLETETDLVVAPLGHDCPDELTLPHGIVEPREKCGWIPGVTMPKIIPVQRDYTKLAEKFNSVGPLIEKAGMGTKGISLPGGLEIPNLAKELGLMETEIGLRPRLDSARNAAEFILKLSGTTNGHLATAGFENLQKRVGTTEMTEMSAGSQDRRISLRDVQELPQPVITSPEWSGSEHGGRRYTAFSQNVEYFKPWHTASGRMHYYLDHDWMQAMGEALPVYRPPLDLRQLTGDPAPGTVSIDGQGQAEVAVRYLTPHNKWAIHSQYFDNLYMLTLGRGGQTVWMSPQDAAKIGVKDNDWIEAYNRNGIVSARAIVSHRMPEGTVFMHHAQERIMHTPLNEKTRKRGGTHNSLTRIFLKPSHLVGGYAQFTYAFNYIGPTGNQRDEVTMIRRRCQEVEF